MGTRLELKSGETNTYEVSLDESFTGVMTYINGEEVSGDTFKTASEAWDKYVVITPQEFLAKAGGGGSEPTQQKGEMVYTEDPVVVDRGE